MTKEALDLLAALRGAYGLDVVDAERVLRGQGARNWVVSGPAGRWFVKQFGPGRDVSAEREAATLSRYCRNADLPTPAVLLTRRNEVLAEAERLAVFEYVADAAPLRMFDAAQANGPVPCSDAFIECFARTPRPFPQRPRNGLRSIRIEPQDASTS